MQLLDNVYSCRPIGVSEWGIDKFDNTLHSKFRPLSLDEKVDYLFDKALNGSAKEYRQICDWFHTHIPDKWLEYGWKNTEYEFHCLFQACDEGEECEQAIKQLIRQALEKETLNPDSNER